MRLPDLRRLLPVRTLRVRLMLTSLLVVALPIAIVGVTLEREGRQALRGEKEDKLFALARVLDLELGPGGYDTLLADLPTGWTDRDAAVRHLNRKLAPVTDRIAAAAPGIGVGYYSKRLDAIVTYGPSRDHANTVGLAIPPDHPGRGVMDAKEPRAEVGTLVRGPILNAMLPIIRDGEAIGYIWSNEFSSAVEAQANAIDIAVVIACLGGLVVAFGIIAVLSRRLSREVDVIVHGLAAMKRDLRRPIPALRDELGAIVEAINGMAKALNDARSLNENILASVADAIVAVDLDGRITAVNPAAEHLYGVTSADVIGKPYRSLFSRDAKVDSVLLDTLQTGRVHAAVTIDLPRAEQTLRINATSSVLRDGDGKRIGAVVVLKDVSERERLMVQVMRADRLAALGELTAGIAHEVRNPLTSIRGFIQYLDECESLDEWRAYGPLIIRQVDSLNHIVSELLAFGRPQPPRIGTVDVARLIEEMAFLARGKSDARIELACDGSFPTIEADGEALKQALLNLIINAIQAIPDGGTVTVSTRTEDDHVAIVVKDDGVGVDPENLDKVFDPFFSTKPSGTGLGLAMVHRIVDAHGGVITFDSAPGKGTVVEIRLPVVHREQPEPVS
ncbi:two-component system sensor histidine kinase AtoS [Rhodoplanes roseus]|uniref:histidine kinase n=1 Tax=Rhodoplanes roseus TaxID=29409 RepID=A0A327KY35_9BRAD|nr:two-component system sensor histidine kinase AtoS [Rhodoplanes roseus]RAI42663.1 two-component system sensor histidine kinase AtoS [Rhodoplanes roseus]